VDDNVERFEWVERVSGLINSGYERFEGRVVSELTTPLSLFLLGIIYMEICLDRRIGTRCSRNAYLPGSSFGEYSYAG